MNNRHCRRWHDEKRGNTLVVSPRDMSAYSGFAAGSEAAGGTSTEGPRGGTGINGGGGSDSPGGGFGLTGFAGKYSGPA